MRYKFRPWFRSVRPNVAGAQYTELAQSVRVSVCRRKLSFFFRMCPDVKAFKLMFFLDCSTSAAHVFKRSQRRREPQAARGHQTSPCPEATHIWHAQRQTPRSSGIISSSIAAAGRFKDHRDDNSGDSTKRQPAIAFIPGSLGSLFGCSLFHWSGQPSDGNLQVDVETFRLLSTSMCFACQHSAKTWKHTVDHRTQNSTQHIQHSHNSRPTLAQQPANSH